MKIKKLNPVTIKNFIKNNFISIVIVLLLFIFAVSLYGSRINKLITEGLGEMPDTSNMEKSNSADVAARAISNSDIVKIISEFVTKINNHDIILQSLDSTFAKNTITIKSEADKMRENINNMLSVMKKQDVEIVKLSTSNRFKSSLPPYIPSPDLPGLIDGKLLADKETRLYNLSHYPLSPTDCSLNMIQSDITDLSNNLAIAQAKFKASSADSSKIDVTSSAIEGQLNMRIGNLATLKQNLKDPNFIKCNPTYSVTDATSISNGLYLTSMSSILEIQDDYINKLQKLAGESIVNSYSQLYNLTAKTE